VDSLRRGADESAPARLQFGPRTIGYTPQMNMSGNGWGDPDARAQAGRGLDRTLDFRKAATIAADRQRMGESLARGPFPAACPGGLYAGTSYYDKESTVYYPYDIEGANAVLDGLGLKDTDGNGVRNFPEGTAGGRDIEITLLANTDYNTDRNLAEGVVNMMQELGLRVILNLQQGTARDDLYQSGRFDWQVFRQTAEMVTVVQDSATRGPTAPPVLEGHHAGRGGTGDLPPVEQEVVEVVDAFLRTHDLRDRAPLMKRLQGAYTEDVSSVGLTHYAGAMII